MAEGWEPVFCISDATSCNASRKKARPEHGGRVGTGFLQKRCAAIENRFPLVHPILYKAGLAGICNIPVSGRRIVSGDIVSGNIVSGNTAAIWDEDVATLDSSTAWQAARRMVSTNRDMLAAIAGVFFLMPGLIAAVVLPTPQLTNGMNQDQMVEAVSQFYVTAGPLLIALSLPMLAGYLTLLAMLLDRDRPTVREAIGRALRLLPSYLVVQVLVALMLSVVAVVALAVLAMVLPQGVATLLALVIMIYPITRTMLIGPEMVAQRLQNPFRAIGAGLMRTRGRFGALALFFGPALTLFLVVYALAAIVVAVILAGFAQPEVQRLASEAVGALLLSVGYVYFTAMIASTYQQFGPINGNGTTISPSTPA